ncbi:MAG: hypothetical protein IT305_06280 [Chloroflexi bacterium]|nr:hypothetical protein [Chloroflexota bacterium]
MNLTDKPWPRRAPAVLRRLVPYAVLLTGLLILGGTVATDARPSPRNGTSAGPVTFRAVEAALGPIPTSLTHAGVLPVHTVVDIREGRTRAEAGFAAPGGAALSERFGKTQPPGDVGVACAASIAMIQLPQEPRPPPAWSSDVRA